MSLLFYNGDSGLSELYNTDGQGGITQLNSYSFVRTTWTHIVPCYEGYYTILLFYDNRSGIAEFYRIDEYGNLSQLSSTTYSTGWTHILGDNFTDELSASALFFYNSASGLGQFYYIDRQGDIHQVSSTTYSTGWTHIVPGTFGLFFYNSRSGLGQFYKTDGRGGIQQLSSATYSTGWTHIVDVPAFQGTDSSDDDLLFYNSNSGLAQFYHTDRQGNINQLSNTTYSTGWTIIEWLEIL